jgi:3-oxoacyl-[acyl-carrier-protein] synthase-3
MRWQDVYLAGLGTWLGTPVPPRSAVDAGILAPERAARLGYASVLVSNGVAPPDMAVAAGRTAVRRSGREPAEFSLVLHNSNWYQGLTMWPCASYVANGTVGPDAPAYELQQRCNAALGSLDLAATHLLARPDAAVLVTTADRFAGPGVDRWNTVDIGFLGDGAAAAVLSRRPGFARLVATVTVAENAFEATSRGDDEFRTAPPANEPVDLVGRHEAFLRRPGARESLGRLKQLNEAARRQVLEEAGAKPGDVTRVITTANRGVPDDDAFHQRLGFGPGQTMRALGRRTGHVGSGDQLIGLTHLLEYGALRPGDLVLLLGGGAGFTCTTALVEILEAPAWTPTETALSPTF